LARRRRVLILDARRDVAKPLRGAERPTSNESRDTAGESFHAHRHAIMRGVRESQKDKPQASNPQ